MIGMDLYREVFGDVETAARTMLQDLAEEEAMHRAREPRWVEHGSTEEEAEAIIQAAERGDAWEVVIRSLFVGMSARGWATARRMIAGTGSLEGAKRAGRDKRGKHRHPPEKVRAAVEAHPGFGRPGRWSNVTDEVGAKLKPGYSGKQVRRILDRYFPDVRW